MLQVEDAHVFSVNAILPAIPNDVILPDSIFTPVDGEQMELYTSCFSQPIKFRWVSVSYKRWGRSCDVRKNKINIYSYVQEL